MLPEALIAIAQLCTTTGNAVSGSSFDKNFKLQLACQKAYIECVRSKQSKEKLAADLSIEHLADCVLEHK